MRLIRACSAQRAGWIIYLLFFTSIQDFETTHAIVRGSEASVKTGRMFGEYYPTATVPFWLACFAEGFGTFLLVLLIFASRKDATWDVPPATPRRSGSA